MNKIVIVCRLVAMSLALLGLNLMYNNLMKTEEEKSIFEIVSISTIVILVSLAYYILCKCILILLIGDKKTQKNRPKDISYMDMQVQTSF